MSTLRHRSSSNGGISGLTQNSSREDAMQVMNAVKADLNEQIAKLTDLKKDIISSD